MIGYHYSPASNRDSIKKHGLLVPKKHPKLTTPVTCSAGHRNPHISLARTPSGAWRLSGDFVRYRAMQGLLALAELPQGIPTQWDLWQVYLPRHSYRAYGYELQSVRDIPKRHVLYIGSRHIGR